MTGPKDPKITYQPGSNPPQEPLQEPISSMTVKTVLRKPEEQPSAPTRAIFTVLKGPEVGRVLALPAGQVITLGRADDCTYRFEEGSLSRVHARVMCIAGQHVVSDAGSTNGTFLNDHRITTPQPLRSGDRVQLGTSLTLGFLQVSEAEEASLRKVYEAALRDALTGVFNRKHLEERLDAEIAFAIRHNAKLSLIIQDVDHFKKVNDTYGHLAGDAVLQTMGRLLNQSVRAEDFVARYGGEEFVLVLRGVDRPGAWNLAERLRQTIASQVVYYENTHIHITSSAGVAELAECGAQRTKAALLALADSRLYQAKQSGRNRVI
ncbi:MAG: GGDEF domain-containing protein [Myxococcales bacterium]|nr:GGDEF domain-containing protein [Polyangiaceae bacterium]MDW8248019.1 GGDEF domain-containing protein [Myxococcales bacterium]